MFDVRLAYRHGEPVRVSVGEASFDIDVQSDDGHALQLIIDGAHDSRPCWLQGTEGWLDAGGICAAFVDLQPGAAASATTPSATA